GVRWRGDRLSGEDQVLRLPDHPGARGDGARRADPADRAGEGGRCRRDRDTVSALPSVARRVAVEAEEGNRQGLRDADPASLATGRRCGRARGVRAEVQASRRPGDAGAREARSLNRAGTLLGGVAGAAVGWGWFEAGWVRLRTLDVTLPRLPAELAGVRIAHLSDFHF